MRMSRATSRACKREARLIAETPRGAAGPTHIAPIAFEIARIADLQEEIFGPVLHVVRWGGEVDAVVAQINALGYGLTLGVQTRIDSRALRIADSGAHRQRLRQPQHDRRGGRRAAFRWRRPVGHRARRPAGRITSIVSCAPRGRTNRHAAAPRRGPRTARRCRSTHCSPASARWAASRWRERVAAVQRAAARLDGDCGRAAARHAEQALTLLADQALPGPTGESNTLRLHRARRVRAAGAGRARRTMWPPRSPRRCWRATAWPWSNASQATHCARPSSRPACRPT